MSAIHLPDHLPALLWLWELLAASLLYSVFCRLVKTRKTTRLDVRLSIMALGLAALLCIGAPLYGWQPDSVTLVLLASMVQIQWVAARHWAHGVPDSFVDTRHRIPRARRAGDTSTTPEPSP